MKIWFDLCNSPHVNLFAALIRELLNEHDVIITSRPHANTLELLELHRLNYVIIGKHYGKKTTNKIFGFMVRIWQLYRYLRKIKPDIAISQSSFHSPITARLLGIPSIYMNDNEYALGNIPAFIFASKILIPEFLNPEKVKRQFAKEAKIVQYPGVKEGIYLWNEPIDYQTDGEKYIYVRPEPWVAQYYNGALNFLDNMLIFLKDKAKVILLPRGKDQAVHYEQEKFQGIEVLSQPLSLEEIASKCKLFIGAGGTMTREMAVLGIPTISVYQDELLDVDQFLINNGMMLHKPNLSGEFAYNYLLKCENQEPNGDLLNRGKDAYELIKSLIIKNN